METHRAAILQSFDVRVGLIAQLFIVGAAEVQCSLVVVFGAAVSPGHRAVAVVGEVLSGLDAEEAEETQLDHAYGLTTGIDVRKLKGGRKRKEGVILQDEGNNETAWIVSSHRS